MSIRGTLEASHAASPTRPPIKSTARIQNKDLWIGLLAGVAIVSVGTILYFLIKWCLVSRSGWRRRRRRRSQMNKAETESSQWGKIELRRFRLEELGKATENFSRDCLVGSGAFGNVYKGTFDEELTLAIKRAHAESYQSVEEFRNEVELLSRVKHRNLVGLVGYCEEAGQKMLVYEYVPNGCLLDYIVGRRGKTLTWSQRVNIAIGAAKGIAHLHEGVKPSIIHRDIKPSNILLGHGFEAKVSDFGLVKAGPAGDQSHVSSQIKGTPGYLDPAYCSSFHLTPFTDVYSFGVILLQLVSARPAVDPSRNHHIIDWARLSLERGAVEDIVDANLLTEACNMEMMLKMGQLGLRCVVKSPRARPKMTQVVRELEEGLRSTTHERCLLWGTHGTSTDEYVSVEGVGLQRFPVDADGLSLHSASMRCLDPDSIADAPHGSRGIGEERVACIDG